MNGVQVISIAEGTMKPIVVHLCQHNLESAEANQNPLKHPCLIQLSRPVSQLGFSCWRMAFLKTAWHQPGARNREKDCHKREAGVKAAHGEVLVGSNSFPEVLPTEELPTGAQWFPHCQHAQIIVWSGRRSACSTDSYPKQTHREKLDPDHHYPAFLIQSWAANFNSCISNMRWKPPHTLSLKGGHVGDETSLLPAPWVSWFLRRQPPAAWPPFQRWAPPPRSACSESTSPDTPRWCRVACGEHKRHCWGWAERFLAAPSTESAQPGCIQAAHKLQGHPSSPDPPHTGGMFSRSQASMFDFQRFLSYYMDWCYLLPQAEHLLKKAPQS